MEIKTVVLLVQCHARGWVPPPARRIVPLGAAREHVLPSLCFGGLARGFVCLRHEPLEWGTVLVLDPRVICRHSHVLLRHCHAWGRAS
jgi:hypothetical protein